MVESVLEVVEREVLVLESETELLELKVVELFWILEFGWLVGGVDILMRI